MEGAATRILQAACDGIAAVEVRGIGLDDYLDFHLKTPELRRTVSHILFHYFRRRASLARRIDRLVRKKPQSAIRHILAATLTQIFYCDGIAPESAVNVAVSLTRKRYGRSEAGFVNAVLRRAVTATGEEPPETPENILPQTVLKHWEKRYSPETLQQLTAAFLTPAQTVFRCRRGRELTASEMAEWQAHELPTLSGANLWQFYSLPSPAPLLASEDWDKGRFYFQDPATAATMALPEYAAIERALDVCCAPGGKSLMIAEMLPQNGLLVAADRSERRQKLTRENFRRHGWSRFPIITAEPWNIPEELGVFDLVLADVPCSNTGVFRRRPDALWRFRPEELQDLAGLQMKILIAAGRRVRPGGQLLYSTCSLEPEENEKRVAEFLKTVPGFSIAAESRLLPTVMHDGAYGCLLRRRRSSNNI